MSIEFSEIGEGGIREDGSSEETNILGDEGDAEDVVEDVRDETDRKREESMRPNVSGPILPAMLVT